MIYFLQVNMFLDEMGASEHVTVTCFGGGPAAELASIVSWLRIEGVGQHVR